MAKKFIDDIEITKSVLDKINRYSIKPLTAEEVYCFSVLLCDNEIDRDYERFSEQSLKTLTELYIGITGILDHDSKGKNQTARIYHTEVKSYPYRKTGSGETYTALMGYAYMVRTEDNKSLIAEIDGGIKKEVSISCSVQKRVCSVCGSDMLKKKHSHIKGKYYGKKLCFATLENPTDAYEWSFVAVPVQKGKKFIEDIPAADVQEVRHGHWIECDYKKLEHGFIENFPDKGLYCSNCRTGFKKSDLRIKNYCPNCGARMDGEET